MNYDFREGKGTIFQQIYLSNWCINQYLCISLPLKFRLGVKGVDSSPFRLPHINHNPAR